MTDVDLQAWIGREETRHDTFREQPAQFMQATLDRVPSLRKGDALPPLWHWLYFLDAKPISDLGRDAHPKKGGFLPPVALPRRMWAGGRFTFIRPLILGQDASKKSTIVSITEKDGRSGRLCFVTVKHEVFQNGTLALSEDHDIVYREDPRPDTPQQSAMPPPDEPAFSLIVAPSEVMLFRYSALTFNGHRIHYDVDYARAVEGYDGLVVHGPLTATLLVDLACTQVGRTPTKFSFRGMAPITGLHPFRIEGRRRDNTVDLWARRGDGMMAMSATASF